MLFVLGEVEIDAVWTQWEEENGGVERKREPCLWVLGESDGKTIIKKKNFKKEKKGMYTRVWCLGSGSGMGPTKSRNI